MLGKGVAFILAGVIMLLVAMIQVICNQSYKSAKTVMAKVIGKRKHYVKNGVSYEVTVSYRVADIVYKKVIGVIKREFETIGEGEEIMLKYKPQNPKRAIRLKELNPRNVRMILLSSIVLLIIGGSLLLC